METTIIHDIVIMLGIKFITLGQADYIKLSSSLALPVAMVFHGLKTMVNHGVS